MSQFHRTPPFWTGAPSVLMNATRALLPLAPLIAEAPALAEYAQRAWPWARAARWWPFAFVGSPFFLESGADFALKASSCRSAALFPPRRNTNFIVTAALSRPAAAPDGAAPASAADAERSRRPCSSRAALDRRGAVRNMAVHFAGIFGASTALLASPSGGPTVATAAVKGKGSGGSGSESPFAEKASYDRFAEDYDALDGGWAASALGIEVRGVPVYHAKREQK